jgi:hypothetical protein
VSIEAITTRRTKLAGCSAKARSIALANGISNVPS